MKHLKKPKRLKPKTPVDDNIDLMSDLTEQDREDLQRILSESDAD